MKIKTKISVTHLDLSKLAEGGSKQGIVTMETGGFSYTEQPTGERLLEVIYRILDEDGRELPTSDYGKFTMSENVEASSTALGNSAPSFPEHLKKDIVSFAKIELAARYKITVENTEEVV